MAASRVAVGHARCNNRRQQLGRHAAPQAARPNNTFRRHAMTYAHIVTGTDADARPVVRHIEPSDLWDSLKRGYDDFTAMPSHAIFLCVIYPILGILLVAMTAGYSALPLAFPIAAGFALIGPIAALGLYELSRRREAGLDTEASHAFDVLHSPSLGAIAALSLMLTAIFVVWLGFAQGI
jgi:uncharacterized membrane protein